MNPDCHYSGQPTVSYPCWILDIDGTLMPSQQVDNRCYWQAVFEHFGEEPRTLDLHDFEHVTDGGILREWMQRQHGREATAAEMAAIRQRFLELVMQAHASASHAFDASPGLVEWLEQRLAEQGRCVAIATGGWGHTARFKLEAAGLDRFRLPLASSDDGDSRQAIMQQALRQLPAAAGGTATLPGSQPVCYIGDGVWDLRAALGLGWDFIGIAADEQARRLRQAGAEQVYCNFAELAASNPHAAIARKHGLHAST